MRVISADRTVDVNYDICVFEVEEDEDKNVWNVAAYLNLTDCENCGYFIMGTYDSQIEAITVMDLVRDHMLNGGKVFKMPTPIDVKEDDLE